MLRRRRKRGLIIFVALICVALLLLVVWPIVSTPSPSVSERLIITADDLGPGWTGTKPEIDPVGGEGPHTAWVRLLFTNGSTRCEVTCHLYAYPTAEQANASYQESIVNTTTGNVLNVGDRAMIMADMNESNAVWHWLLTMQKGNVVVWMSALSDDGPAIDEMQMIELAEIQAAKMS
jgi:hypothetical protein